MEHEELGSCAGLGKPARCRHSPGREVSGVWAPPPCGQRQHAQGARGHVLLACRSRCVARESRACWRLAGGRAGGRELIMLTPHPRFHLLGQGIEGWPRHTAELEASTSKQTTTGFVTTSLISHKTPDNTISSRATEAMVAQSQPPPQRRHLSATRSSSSVLTKVPAAHTRPYWMARPMPMMPTPQTGRATPARWSGPWWSAMTGRCPRPTVRTAHSSW